MMQETRHCPLPDRFLVGNVLSGLKQAVQVYTEAALEAATPASRRMFQQLAHDAMMKFEQLESMAEQHRLFDAADVPVSQLKVQQVSRLAAETASHLRQLVNARLSGRHIPQYTNTATVKPPEFMLPHEVPFAVPAGPFEPDTKQEEAAEKKALPKRGRKAKGVPSAVEAEVNSESHL